MVMLTGEEVRAKGYNPDTLVSVGGKYDSSQFNTPAPAPGGAVPSNTAIPTTATPPGADPNRLYTGEEIRAMGYNPDTQVSQGGKFSLSQFTGGRNGGSGISGGIGITPAVTLNLPDLYKSLTDSSGVGELESGLKAKADAFQKAQSQINDNPFLSEATRVGRVSKLTTDYNTSIKNDQDALAMKKQDIQTQLDLQTKQFDINSSASKQALDQFNVLLQSGALAGASGNDIAAITKATGISSSMIQTAIKAQTQKDMKTSVSTVDDGTAIWSVVIDSNTGNIISKQQIGKSKPSSTGSTATEKQAALQSQFITALENKKNSYGHVSPQDWQGALASWISRGGTAADFIANFKQYADPNRGDFDTAYYERK